MLDFANLIAYAALAGAIYGAIRSDLRSMKENIKHAHKSAKHAHRRIDDLIKE